MADKQANRSSEAYHRYHLETQEAPDLFPWPSRFQVKVGKAGLAKHLITEMLHTNFDMEVVTSRPCLYGVFSGPIGGFAPRPKLCVGCLRCTTEFPEFVQVLPNPERLSLGDSYFTYQQVEAVAYEAQGGRIPVKGAGYRGPFGGENWDGIWTDMSEIVRPTRDGIHGREFISTLVIIGEKVGFLEFDSQGRVQSQQPRTISLPVPFIFDRVHPKLETASLYNILGQAAEAVETLQVLPIDHILDHNLRGPHLVPLLKKEDYPRVAILPFTPRLVELDGWDERLYQSTSSTWPEALICLRIPFNSPDKILEFNERGIKIFHLTANYHGRDATGRFIFDSIRQVHEAFVEAGRRDEVTLLGSGGIVAAEHVPKAIIAGLDAVGLDVPLLVALQGRLQGEFSGQNGAAFKLPGQIPPDWGVQRLTNLAAAWRDQLLEVLGAMGLREVRRLRGEMGRALFMVELEQEAFAEIEGYHGR